MTTLLLVRHGPTEWTGEHRLQGRTDIDLSASGRAHTLGLVRLIAAWKPASVVTSPLSRARTTAALLSDLEPTLDERWAEAGLGEWEGLTPDDIGSDYTRWRAGELVPPGGERLRDVRERVARAADDAARLPGPVLIVTHGGTIRAALAHHVGLTADRLQPVAAPSLTVLDLTPGGDARLAHYNLTGQSSAM